MILYNGTFVHSEIDATRKYMFYKQIILLFLLAIFFLYGCNKEKGDDPSHFVPRPIFNPTASSFTEPIIVQITCSMAEARIFYTKDGSAPTNQSILYISPITLEATTTLKAIAYRVGYRTSEITTSVYSYNKVEVPHFSLESGVYNTEQELSLYSQTASAEIYVTSNGAEPIEHPIYLYDIPLLLPGELLNPIIIKAKAFREGWLPSETVTHRYEFNLSQMILVRGGSFTLSPGYTILLSDFSIGNYLVTQGEWASVMEGNNNEISSRPSYFVDQGNNPVECISWYETLVYCNRLSILEGLEPVYSKDGYTNPYNWGPIPNSHDMSWDDIIMDMNKNGYRLPTEMEWYYAARGGILSQEEYLYSGSYDIDEVAWYNLNSGTSAHVVGQKKSNELGLYDMSGNVEEWCFDWWGVEFPNGGWDNPTGPENGVTRVVKGGSWAQGGESCKIISRADGDPFYRQNDRGFRIVKRDF